MKRIGNGRTLLRNITENYISLPGMLRSRNVHKRRSAQKLLAVTICVPLIIACLGYMLHWETTRAGIERDNAAFRALYKTPVPTDAPTLIPTPEPTPKPIALPSVPVAKVPAQESSATPEPTPTPVPSPTPVSFEIAVDLTAQPLATPDADTIILAMETPPPVQHSFDDLLALNPETAGFLRIGKTIVLPVVQRSNDNEYYLDHSFNHEKSIAGTLFLDGSNLLVPEDQNLIIYGHNMRNGTMFRPLTRYENLDFLKENPIIRFDTIYRNRSYAPFAVFTVTAEPDSDRYLNIRRFMLDEAEWNDYISGMRSLSEHSIPIDVVYGDHVLLLVTCEYTHNNGRFVVAFRALREEENEADIAARIQKAK